MTSLLDKQLSRRDFVKGSGALVVAFSLPLSLANAAKGATGAAQAIGPASIDDELIDSWIVIRDTGRVTIQVGKVELGTGIKTAPDRRRRARRPLELHRLPGGRHLGDARPGHDRRKPVAEDAVGRGLRHAAAEACGAHRPGLEAARRPRC